MESEGSSKPIRLYKPDNRNKLIEEMKKYENYDFENLRMDTDGKTTYYEPTYPPAFRMAWFKWKSTQSPVVTGASSK